jgi:hypothetical protein
MLSDQNENVQVNISKEDRMKITVHNGHCFSRCCVLGTAASLVAVTAVVASVVFTENGANLFNQCAGVFQK